MEIKIFRKITDIPCEEWGRVYPKVPEDYFFYKTLDESLQGQFKFYYVMVYEDGLPVGAAPCFTVDFSLETSVQGPLRSVLSGINKLFPNILTLRTLMCGLPMGQGRIGSTGDHTRVLEAILEGMERIAHEQKVALLVFKDFSGAYDGILSGLPAKGFCRMEGLPLTEMNVSFKDFEAYLKSLSYASRYDLRRKFKKVDGHVDIRMEELDRLDDRLDEVYPLYQQAVARHEINFEVLPKEFFARAADNMPGKVKYFIWSIGGKTVGFAFCLVDGDQFVDYYVGFDYAVALEHHLFFVRFRDLLNWCLKRGIRKYDMGYTSYEPKRRLGFGLLPLNLYIKHRGPVANRFVKFFCRWLRFDKFDPALRQMKEKNK